MVAMPTRRRRMPSGHPGRWPWNCAAARPISAAATRWRRSSGSWRRLAASSSRSIEAAMAGRHGASAGPSLDAIEEVVREFRDRGVDILAICGGDGSDHCTLTAVDRVYGATPWPLLLPLRAGTINYVADDIGERSGTPEQTLQKVANAHRRGHAHVTTERS